jgi:hypothetical protein
MDRSFPTVITLGNQRQITVHTENTNTSSEQLINSNPFVAECLTCPSIFLQGQSLYYHGKNSSRSPLRSLVFGGSYVELSSHLFSLLPCCGLKLKLLLFRYQLHGGHAEWYGLDRENCAVFPNKFRLSTGPPNGIRNRVAKGPRCRGLWSCFCAIYDRHSTRHR